MRTGSVSMTATPRSVVTVLMGAVWLSAGCGGGSAPPPKAVPVKGIVLLRGEPLANARVSFYAKGAPMPAVGDTNESGEFVLTTYKTGDGAIVGENKVTVVGLAEDSKDSPMMPPDATKIASGKFSPDPSAAAVPRTAKRGKDSIPPNYSDVVNTPLIWTVKPEGEENVKLELK